MLHGCWKGHIDIFMAYIFVLFCMDRDDELHFCFIPLSRKEGISFDIVDGDWFCNSVLGMVLDSADDETKIDNLHLK